MEAEEHEGSISAAIRLEGGGERRSPDASGDDDDGDGSSGGSGSGDDDNDDEGRRPRGALPLASQQQHGFVLRGKGRHEDEELADQWKLEMKRLLRCARCSHCCCCLLASRPSSPPVSCFPLHTLSQTLTPCGPPPPPLLYAGR